MEGAQVKTINNKEMEEEEGKTWFDRVINNNRGEEGYIRFTTPKPVTGDLKTASKLFGGTKRGQRGWLATPTPSSLESKGTWMNI